jgi:curved DNA-binding protein CbpA
MADPADHYKVLQVDSEADPDVIQAAYRRLAQKFHPDVAQGPEAGARMVAINEAWRVLSQPAARAAYDLERAARAREAAAALDPPARPSTTGHAEPATNRSSAGSRPATPPRPPEPVSGDWTTGRSTIGGGYDPATMRASEGLAAAGPPPGNPSGTVLAFGRYAGWSLGEIARSDLDYIEWLDRMPIGRPYRDEIDAILRRVGRRRSGRADESERRGLFRRR